MQAGDPGLIERFCDAKNPTIGCWALTEPDHGSDLGNAQTRAVRDGDEYVVNGSKTFISSGINADLVVTVTRTGEDPHGGLTLLVIEDGMEGFDRGRNLDKMGLHAQDTAELFFENVRIPAENLLGDPHKGFYSLMHFLAEERLISAAQAVAHGQIAGEDPSLHTMPSRAVKNALDKTDLTIDDIDLFEVNEAFASVVLAWQKETGADMSKVNVNGGAIALGHPLGMSGARLAITALDQLQKGDGHLALCTMCIGVGQGIAVVVEKP